MVLKKKITTQKALREEIISRAGAVKEDNKAKKKNTYFCLRLPLDIKQIIMEKVETRVGISKNTWILEAILEKLDKDEL